MVTYGKLTPHREEIRLLTVHAGARDAPLKCDLSVVSLATNPKYEALSYVWGSPDKTFDIEVNGEPFAVTVNLHAALVRLRSSQEPRILWVDAVCINQNDSPEKVVQVGLMGSTYRKAERGLLWLGEEPRDKYEAVTKKQTDEIQALIVQADDVLDSALSVLYHVTFDLAAVDSLRQSTLTQRNQPMPKDDFRILPTMPAIWYGDKRDKHLLDRLSDPALEQDSIFHAFCLFRMLDEGAHLSQIPYLRVEPKGKETYLTNGRRAAHWLASVDWWTRMWTIQECIMPPSCTVVYGPVEASWSTIMNGILSFQSHRNSCCSTVPGVHEMFNFHIDTVLTLETVRQARAMSAPNVFGTSCTLEFLIRHFRHRAATDPRDKIYALLSLVTDWGGRDLLRPSYQTPEVDVYREATLKMIEISSHLDIFCQPVEVHGKRLQGLPTWVPDYSQQLSSGGTHEHFLNQVRLYNACGRTLAKTKVLGDGILVLDGIRIDQIKRASTTMIYNTSTGLEKDTFSWWHSVAREELADSNGAWRTAFWRTMVGDCIFEADFSGWGHRSRRATASDRNVYDWWCHQNGLTELMTEPLKDDLPKSRRYHGWIETLIKATTQTRRFMISKGGRMGMVPALAVLTHPTPDEIWVLRGGRSLFVLRPIGQKDVPGQGMQECHELVGDCYLHGFMDGEAADNFEMLKQTVYIV